ncbi:hypothetical protein ACSSS7_005713 [Eimeria intestinalis]
MSLQGGTAGAPVGEAQQQQQPSTTPSAREAHAAAAAAAAAEAQMQQQMHYLAQQQQQQQYAAAAQGITHAYPGMLQGGGPVDPTQAQVAAFANQAAMYGPFGSPYALNMPPPPTGGPYYPGAPPHFSYPGMESFSLPGPAYFDPYGMINPAACVAPTAGPEHPEVEAAKHPRRKSKKWFGCC